MHEHGPDELIGPLRGTTAWWRGMEAPLDPVREGTTTPQPPVKKRRASSTPPIRKELVERIRGEIAAGTYDTEEKWEAALDRLLDRLDQKS
jgi:negative regulator of flagellin synthesis FlgM